MSEPFLCQEKRTAQTSPGPFPGVPTILFTSRHYCPIAGLTLIKYMVLFPPTAQLVIDKCIVGKLDVSRQR